MESVITNSPVNDLKVFVPYDLRDLYKLLEPIALNGTVMTSFTDSGYLRHFYTFYRLSHLERYPNFFVTAIDQNAFDSLHSKGIPVYFYHPSNVDSSALQQSSVITSKSFYKKVVNKLTYLSRLMSIGFRVLYMDCDIILFKDPWPVLNQYSEENTDVVTQKDDSLNSGFMFLLPTAITRAFLKSGARYMVSNNELDQESLVAVLGRHSGLRLVLLPEDQFSSGRVFFSQHQFYWDPISPQQIMMHNNYIVGSENKFYRWREMRFYDDDSDGYYSSSERRYLMVDASEERKNNTLYLHQVAVLSRLLNRTFLLPTFLCPPTIPLEKCNLCRNDVECFKRFRLLIQMQYRDYAFRNHPLTPEDVKNAIRDDPVYCVKLVSSLPSSLANNVV
ncbi:hypothetical protein JH06_3712 [Blastocystis sp. subtype 4]|uniref:hypothetical protein n=1 Tax=Blastocystis sp. subtype 4 TaxID=944170 RepID=UPI000711B936|nr:hypothetical protein JH06_3712 [Blastocystis sp. subtype 4]KNB42809.1 hypothetical protein JH06_3712 [Blastocystis sp. subtype 4]|eukprot:XP_014526252.1 hypothetical protein JH06_3712 [Blastocystis sp. subtype 4]